MQSYSLEIASENIVDPKSREYFSEVLGAYANGHYRSCVVMLWSVVICDLIYKLRDLRDIHLDTVANSLLADITARQTKNPTSSDWEGYLLDRMHAGIAFLEPAEYASLKHLRDMRHLSAHPVLDAADLLACPTKETTRALIRVALDGVLCKPPVFAKNIIDRFTFDLAAKKDLLPDGLSLKRYLQAKYLKHLSPQLRIKLVRFLWKFCFTVVNADTEANRGINVRCLAALQQDDPGLFLEAIRSHRDAFSELSHDEKALESLASLLETAPEIYRELTDKATAIFEAFIEAHPRVRARAFYTSQSLEQHVSLVLAMSDAEYLGIRAKDHAFIVSLCDSADQRERLQARAIDLYASSGSYDSADRVFLRCVKPFIKQLESPLAQQLLNGIENNSQTHARRSAYSDHRLIKSRAEELGIVDFSKWPLFLASCRLH
jgi:hypothetical protein